MSTDEFGKAAIRITFTQQTGRHHWRQGQGNDTRDRDSPSQGKGKLTLTGNLGDVMKESATTALSYIKANAQRFAIDDKLFQERDIHIHVPQGAIPKDGPSAGITMMTAIVSAFTKKPIKNGIAMSGEITLRGKVLPVGGIKEKVLAAMRSGLKTIILSAKNEKDVSQIDKNFIKGVKFKFVDNMDEVLKLTGVN